MLAQRVSKKLSLSYGTLGVLSREMASIDMHCGIAIIAVYTAVYIAVLLLYIAVLAIYPAISLRY